MRDKFNMMETYLTDNRLCINPDKTHTIVTCTKQKRRFVNTSGVTLDTGTEVISPSPEERLLGWTVHQDLGFGAALLTGRNSVVSAIDTRIRALKMISRVSSFKTRLSVCSALVVSKILYITLNRGGGENGKSK